MLFEPDELPELFAGGFTFGIGMDALTGGYADCRVFAAVNVFVELFGAMIMSPYRRSF